MHTRFHAACTLTILSLTHLQVLLSHTYCKCVLPMICNIVQQFLPSCKQYKPQMKASQLIDMAVHNDAQRIHIAIDLTVCGVYVVCIQCKLQPLGC